MIIYKPKNQSIDKPGNVGPSCPFCGPAQRTYVTSMEITSTAGQGSEINCAAQCPRCWAAVDYTFDVEGNHVILSCERGRVL